MPRSLGDVARILLCCSGSLALVHGVQLPRANAQEAAASSRAPADDLLTRGIQSREAGRDAEALELFRQADALDPQNPRVLAHLGATYQALGRWVSAHGYLSRALEQGKDPYIQRHRDELEEALATVGEHIGFLEINGAPDGAEALINGQLVATLPMTGPVPVIAGAYQLEVRFAGHYTLTRPITVSKRVLTREDVELAPHPRGAGAQDRPAPLPGSASAGAEGSGGATWLPWVLAGVSVAATATTVVAWQRREHYAERWNDDAACLGVGVSREERCGEELDRGKQAETVLWVSGVAAGVFAAGAVITAIWTPGEEREQVSQVRCAPGWGGAACFGTFCVGGGRCWPPAPRSGWPASDAHRSSPEPTSSASKRCRRRAPRRSATTGRACATCEGPNGSYRRRAAPSGSCNHSR
jgi:hypothetical protein